MNVGDHVLCDSHAIALYLCNQGDNNLYPAENIMTKARIDEMLFFNSSSLFQVDSKIFVSTIFFYYIILWKSLVLI